ncbi:DUF3710 domain-containing protein, partial [Rhodococcus aerolatus]
MVFGRGRRGRDGDAGDGPATTDGAWAEDDAAAAEADDLGPWDVSEVDDDADPATVLDLGSVRVPMPEGGQVQVEMDPAGAVRSVHVGMPTGRITVAAFAAPRSPGQWREVAGELAAQLRTDGAQVSIVDGPWGREVLGVTATTSLRFLGVDGPRWMVRCVVACAPDADPGLSATAREVLADTVVVRGTDPLPVRTPLPVVLPEPLVAQLQAAQAQAAQQAPAQQAAAERSAAPRDASAEPPVARQPADGSALQQ